MASSSSNVPTEVTVTVQETKEKNDEVGFFLVC
jgi:hypothetical protein